MWEMAAECVMTDERDRCGGIAIGGCRLGLDNCKA
jgi:hypothetical protein